MAHAEGVTVKTKGGNEFGISVSSYSYEESSLGVSIKGDKFGIAHVGTLVLENVWFIKEDVLLVNGSVDYSGSGFQTGVPDWYVEARGVIGRDIQVGSVTYSPYAGFGYRHLFNDLRGYSSSGAIGYRRESNYVYIPVGVIHRFLLQDSAVLATTLEFDHLMNGRQESKLSDLVGHSGYSSAVDVRNTQRSGFGFRADVMYEVDGLAFGPFLTIWRISQSDSIVKPIVQNGGTSWYYFSEPENRTTEFGLRMRYRF